mmetsp:Transcript_9504/g.15801  ORF Transcript_9504/g.15801 Transcript_9504/m.15801 type:complete len:243 (-) Transcript_9504:82-810(-)
MNDNQQQDNIIELEEGVLKGLAAYWPLFILRGVITLLFGFLFLVFPQTTIATFSILFGVFLIMDGLACLFKMCIICLYIDNDGGTGKQVPLSLLYFLTFAGNMILGIFAISYPDLTAQILLLVVAIWFVLIGCLELLLLCLFRADPILIMATGGGGGIGGVCMVLGGVMYLCFGIVLLSNLEEGVLGVTRFMGIIIMLFAFQMIFFGIRLKTVFNNKGGGTTSNGTTEDVTLVVANPDAAVV